MSMRLCYVSVRIKVLKWHVPVSAGEDAAKVLRHVSYIRKLYDIARARRLVRTGCCFFQKKHKPPEPVVVGSKPTGPATF
jgi:hypothetical protein